MRVEGTGEEAVNCKPLFTQFLCFSLEELKSKLPPSLLSYFTVHHNKIHSYTFSFSLCSPQRDPDCPCQNTKRVKWEKPWSPQLIINWGHTALLSRCTSLPFSLLHFCPGCEASNSKHSFQWEFTVRMLLTTQVFLCAISFHSQGSLMRSTIFVFSFCRSVVLNQGRFCPREHLSMTGDSVGVQSCRSQGCAKHAEMRRMTSYKQRMSCSKCQWCCC